MAGVPRGGNGWGVQGLGGGEERGGGGEGGVEGEMEWGGVRGGREEVGKGRIWGGGERGE